MLHFNVSFNYSLPMKQKKVDIFKPLLSVFIPIILVIILFAAAINVGIISIGAQEKIIYKNSNSSALGNETTGITATVIIDFGNEKVLSNSIISKNNPPGAGKTFS